MDRAQRRLMLEALALCKLPLEKVWLHYCGNGGHLGEAQVGLFLQGAAPMGELERDILAHAINEMLWDRRLPSLVPYASSPVTDREASAGPGTSAAAAWLLTDGEAETERLRSLAATGLMHSGPAPLLDALVAEARGAFGVSSASVSLVGAGYQHLKASVGSLQWDLPRREAFCDEAIRTADPLVIPDTHTDNRFSDHPLVVDEPHLRFYAAHPLRGPGGWNIGTFCLLDRRAHAFPGEERRSFRAFARRAQQEIGRSRHAEEAWRRSAESN
ncbi:GAF domain-containing protein [Arthrobacter sp. NPDC092385]|uniref:GAF domain-containing protein n=1 Tax=Arthrobacter sp. NPDC092385 TaxID=3363943 RepID=UPI0038072585